MNKNRLEAFSDGVLAIIITIMVLELKVPHEVSFSALADLAPKFLCYILSFVYVGIYWNNHHHLFHAVQKVNGPTLWANSHLLFWLSLIPFATAWMGENHFQSLTVALYGFVLLMNGVAFGILVRVLVSLHGKDSLLGRAIGTDFKGNISVVAYVVGIAVSFFSSWLATAIYAVVALTWLIPDRRIEDKLHTY